MQLDDYQKEVIEYDGNIALRAGRQVGKSTCISLKCAQFCLKNPGVTVLIVASVERQAYLLFEKTFAYLFDNYRAYIKTGKDRPTKHIINLKNGSRIYSLPCGLDGHGVRGLTCDMIIFDEAAFIPEEVYISLIPSLMTKKTRIVLLSTPFGSSGYFFQAFSDPNFKTFHVSSVDCPRANKEFLEQERKRMTRAQFAQEYEGEFVQELAQYFPSQLIKECMTIDPNEPKSLVSTDHNRIDIFAGCDIAALGSDSTVLISVARKNNDTVFQVGQIITNRTRITDTIRLIKDEDKKFNYKKIYIDSGGLGTGVTSVLLEDFQTKRKVVEINNSTRSIDREGVRHKTLMKEDLYNNLLRLMESGKIHFYNDPEVMLSLKSVQYEYTDDGRLKLHGQNTHLCEAFVRAAWCMQDKTRGLWIR